MVNVFQNLQPLLNNGVRFNPFNMRNEANATGIMLGIGIQSCVDRVLNFLCACSSDSF